jgi:2-methylcitrate dehydratase PrpD
MPAKKPSLSAHLAAFCHSACWDTLPPKVQERARLHVLDSLGLALASHTQTYAAPALAGICAAGSPGECTVIGDERRLAARDAALANGLLIHGLDYDDTHLASIVHPSVVGLPAALAIGEQTNASWTDVLTAYAVGVETGIRIGLAVKGGFHHAGFHATSIVSHFGAALAAGKLLGLNEAQLVAAQGIAASTTSGVQVFLDRRGLMKASSACSNPTCTARPPLRKRLSTAWVSNGTCPTRQSNPTPCVTSFMVAWMPH